MSSKRIHVVAGDRGGLNAALPVLSIALQNGHEVTAYLAVTCAKQWQDGSLKFDQRIKAEVLDVANNRLLADSFSDAGHDITIICSSQSDGGAIAAARAALTSRPPILAIQDMYGSLSPSLKLIGDCSPATFDRMTICVTDVFSKSMLRAAQHREFPRLKNSQIIVTGGPQFDHVPETKETWLKRRNKLRRAIDAESHNPVFLVVGQLNGTAEMLALINAALDDGIFTCKSLVICRPHPRSTWLDKEMLSLIDRKQLRFVTVDPGVGLAPFPESLLPAADYVLSGYSTVNYFGILCGHTGVIYAGTPSLKWDLWHEKGLVKPPEVEAGAGWYVESPDDLKYAITQRRKGRRSADCTLMMDAQEAIRRHNDGHAAERVWSEAVQLMS